METGFLGNLFLAEMNISDKLNSELESIADYKFNKRPTE